MSQQPIAEIKYDTDTHEWVAIMNGEVMARVQTAPGHDADQLVRELALLGEKLGKAAANMFL